MLLSLVYLAVRRLLRLLTEGDRPNAARDIEILVLRHQLRVLSRGRRLREGYIYSDSCRNPVILVDQSAEPGNAEHLTGGAGQGWLGFRGLKRQPPMRSLLVVVADVLPEDSQEMSLAADEDVVRTLAPCGSHESFGDGVCRGRAYRRADDPHSF